MYCNKPYQSVVYSIKMPSGSEGLGKAEHMLIQGVNTCTKHCHRSVTEFTKQVFLFQPQQSAVYVCCSYCVFRFVKKYSPCTTIMTHCEVRPALSFTEALCMIRVHQQDSQQPQTLFVCGKTTCLSFHSPPVKHNPFPNGKQTCCFILLQITPQTIMFVFSRAEIHTEIH